MSSSWSNLTPKCPRGHNLASQFWKLIVIIFSTVRSKDASLSMYLEPCLYYQLVQLISVNLFLGDSLIGMSIKEFGFQWTWSGHSGVKLYGVIGINCSSRVGSNPFRILDCGSQISMCFHPKVNLKSFFDTPNNLSQYWFGQLGSIHANLGHWSMVPYGLVAVPLQLEWWNWHEANQVKISTSNQQSPRWKFMIRASQRFTRNRHSPGRGVPAPLSQPLLWTVGGELTPSLSPWENAEIFNSPCMLKFANFEFIFATRGP